MRRAAMSARAFLATLLSHAGEPTAGSAVRGNMTSHVARRAISSCLALRGDGNAALGGSFRARAGRDAPFQRRAVLHAPGRRCGRNIPLAAGDAAPSDAPAESVSSSDSWREDAARWAAGLDAGAAAAAAETLAAEIAKHDARYYLDADPDISDAAYDRLRVRLEALEEAHPEARRRDSPTGRVGAPREGFSPDEASARAEDAYRGLEDTRARPSGTPLARVAHVAPMRSLSNVFSDEEARAWERKLRRALGGAWHDDAAPAGGGGAREETAVAFVAEPKIDGASVSVTYVDGVLWRCVSRGDGFVGEDVSRQLAGCVGIPKRLGRKKTRVASRGGGVDDVVVPGYLEVRGEAFIADADFARVNERRLERGLVPFKNARNAVAGAMRRLDPPAGDGTDAGPLRFAAYAWGAVREKKESAPDENVTGSDDPEAGLETTPFWRSQREFKAFAARLGLDPVPTLAAGDGVRSVLRAHESLARERSASLLRDAPLETRGEERGEDRSIVHGSIVHGSETSAETPAETPASSFGYAVDGVVYKVDDVSLQRRLGADARAPRWAAAHKFRAAAAVTTLTAIEVQVGRTGALTPVAVLHPPAELGGASVRRATLHNFHDLERKGLHRAVGRRVLVERAGDVIPRVVGTARGADADENDDDDEEEERDEEEARPPYRPPTSCPSCGSAVRASPLLVAGERETAVLRCTGGLRCPAQAVERIAHFVSRDALDVPGLAKTQIAAMHAEGVVTSPADLFTLRARFAPAAREGATSVDSTDGVDSTDAVVATEPNPARWAYASGPDAGSLKRSAAKLFAALDGVAARGVPLRRFLFALGIRGVGRETAAALAKAFGTLEAFREAAAAEAGRALADDGDGGVGGGREALETSASTSALRSVDGVGPGVAATVGEFFAEPANVAALDATLANGVRVLPDDDDGDASKTRDVDGSAFAGRRVVVTGSVPGMTRAEALAAVTDAGGIAQKAVSGKTDVLVAGDGAGRRKAEAAVERGVRVIDARTFLGMVFPDAADE